MWVKTSDTFVELPIWEDLGPAAYMLHMAAISFCNRNLTDGRISRRRAARLLPAIDDAGELVGALVDSGLWLEDAGGLIVALYVNDLRRSDGRGDDQPAAEAMRARNRQAAERIARFRARRNGVTNAADNAVTNTVQTRPDPKESGLGPDVELAECQHGTPGGDLLTRAGKPRCPQCRLVAAS